MFLEGSATDKGMTARDPLHRERRFFGKIARNPAVSFLLPFLLVLLGRLLLLHEVPPPQPLVQDEFSYLLASDTFASFRLTNPSHPLWEHFETIHELMQPTYMSKYPPMQGVILAFGQIVFGSPWMGVIVSMALFCGLLPWALRAWVPCGWALIGALLAADKIGIMSYWTESYWGGGAAAIGGVLVLGSIRRLSLAPTPGMTVLFVFGAGILGNSRPFEGAVFLLGCGGYLAWKWWGAGRWRRTWPAYPRAFVPVACLTALPILLLMGYYNYRVTGKVTELPYQTFERQYSIWTPFVWQTEPRPAPVYRHDFVRREWIDWDGTHKAYERKHWPWIHFVNFMQIIWFYFGPAFFLGGFMFLPALLLSAKNRTVLFLLLFYYAGTRVMSDIIPHYTAPVAALIFLAVLMSLRTTWFFAPGGFPLGKGLVLIVLALFLMVTSVLRTDPDNRFLFDKSSWLAKRRQVLAFLEKQPGPQLVLVRHGPRHDINEVWTYNKADIDAAPIVWVDSMTPHEDQRVLDYYGGRRTIWQLDDDAELTLRPYGHPDSAPLLKIDNPPVSPLPE